MMMPKQGSRAIFDSLLAKTHVQYALLLPDGRQNEIPAALATLVLLDGAPDLLQVTYDSMKDALAPWEPSPRSIADEEGKQRFLGDVRFQRALMSYFSMELGRFAGYPNALATFHLFTGDRPLIYGLFSGIGSPLSLLSDGIELRAAILVMESLTLSAVGWMEPMRELLTHPQLAVPANGFLSAEDIMGRVGYDGRFSGLMKAGPGFQDVPYVFSSPAARTAIVEYIRYLDTRDIALLLQQFSALSALLLCATHKPGHPAFDFYLSRLPTCVNSARVILDNWVKDGSQRVQLVRGLWLVMILAYITQLRPVIDGKLLASKELAEESRDWEVIYDELRTEAPPKGKHADIQLLRVLRSLRELSRLYGVAHGRLYFHAAWKLVKQWQGWTGLGKDREVMLNIRL